ISEKTKLDTTTSVAIDDKSISFGENGTLLVKSFQFAKDSVLNNVSNRYPAENVDFGRDFSGKLWNLNFDKALIKSVQSKEDGDNYTFQIVFPNGNNPFDLQSKVNDSFHMSEVNAMLRYLQENYKSFAAVENIKVKCTDLEINSTVNRLSNKISNITYIKKLKIEADVRFLGELSAVGTRRMSFIFEENNEFNFTWANLALLPKTLALKKGDIKVIAAKITASSDMKVSWSSSAPEIASVGSDGYVEAHEVSATPVFITAKFDFLGETYTDTSEVYVTVPVNKVTISDNKLVLAKGETKTIKANVKPDDATIKDVLWYSSNPSIASVDKLGKITAVAKGETNVYVLSKDGFYKITCAVTVTG
ncbi:MAG: Ig-like domain-containing protein, partial [Eubacteriales bacterium]